MDVESQHLRRDEPKKYGEVAVSSRVLSLSLFDSRTPVPVWFDGAAGRNKHWEVSMKFGNIDKLCYFVRETSFAVHRYHRDGHAEKIYENALADRLRKQGIEVQQQHPRSVFDENGKILGIFHADLLVEGRLVVELEAARVIGSERVAQILGHFRSLRIETGLLINFGAPVLSVKKYLMSGPHMFWCLFAAYCGEQVIW